MNQEINTPAESVTQSESKHDGQSARRLKLALALSVLALFAVGLLWLSSIKNNQAIERALASKLDAFNEKNQQSLALAKNADTRSSEIAARAEILEEKYT